MSPSYVRSADGTRIAYDQTGEGPGLLLLHGLGPDRSIWTEYGWVERLRTQFTVVSVDLRDHGESDHPTDPAAYAAPRFVEDVEAVADACGFESFLLFGWSFGGSIGVQVAAALPRLRRAVLAGTAFGRLFTEERWGPAITRWEGIVQAQERGELDLDTLPPSQRTFLEETNLPARIALWRGMITWPAIEPAQVRCPVLLYTGTRDHSRGEAEAQRDALEQAGVGLHVFEGLDHVQLISAPDQTFPLVRDFLLAGEPAS